MEWLCVKGDLPSSLKGRYIICLNNDHALLKVALYDLQKIQMVLQKHLRIKVFKVFIRQTNSQ